MATDSSFGLATTFGAYAFQNATTLYDAFIIKKMRDAGLIILGKTNLAVKLDCLENVTSRR
jgi:Asp-tRNA(Asn)/Glu-tRNA(Gln) amidotransferase A subunit family amidase